MRRYSLTARRVILALMCSLVASLAVVASAQAVVITDGSSTTYGVALVPNASWPVNAVTPGGTCVDPSLTPDLKWLTVGDVSPICYHNGPIIPQNETYALTWDPDRMYWAETRKFVQGFLSDVAAGSNTFTSPYALTTQYTDQSGNRVANKSIYAGGCIDYGTGAGDQTGYTCGFGANHPSGTGNDYPANGCPRTGLDEWYGQPNGPIDQIHTPICLTDAQLKVELQAMLPQMGLPGGNQPGYTPLVVLLTPPGVQICLDSSGDVCSAVAPDPNNAAMPQAQFCSYHSQVDVGGTEITYVVQPWTARAGQGVACDDPSGPDITFPVNQVTLADQVGGKLVSPLSQAELAALTDPAMNGWYNSDNGDEINDNGCFGLGSGLDNVTVGANTYALQREFNNAGAIETDPNALPCSGTVNLVPQFVVPGPVDQTDNVLFDGSVTNSTLLVPNAGYVWNFGDGTTGSGPSVYHSYAKAGNYPVTLTVTDRGGNKATITQTVTVLDPNGQAVPSTTSSSGSGSGGSGNALKVQVRLMPQSLKAVLRDGMVMSVTSNQPANGIATVWIARAAARKAGMNVGRGVSPIRIGLGTVSSIKNGTVLLRLHLSRTVAKKLNHLKHVAMTIRLSLVAPGNQRYAVDVAGKY